MPAKSKSRRANGKNARGMDGRSAEARRLTELIEAFSAGIEVIDEATLAVIRGAALMAQQLERLEERVTRGEEIDEMKLQRLSNSLTRLILGLNAMKTKQPPQSRSADSLGGHLAALVAKRRAERERLEAEASTGE